MHLVDDERLKGLIHSSKFRTKDPEHLLEKLRRKHSSRSIGGGRESASPITRANVLSKVSDLVGVRLLHLHTVQMEQIHPAITEILHQNRYRLREKPVVYFWDIESRDFFERLGIKAIERREMYTSVHYVVSPATRPEFRIELQVRTLMEEVWGEVSHLIDYPEPTDVLACREQLRVLARITSGCSRLVDSIFATRTAAESE